MVVSAGPLQYDAVGLCMACNAGDLHQAKEAVQSRQGCCGIHTFSSRELISCIEKHSIRGHTRHCPCFTMGMCNAVQPKQLQCMLSLCAQILFMAYLGVSGEQPGLNGAATCPSAGGAGSSAPCRGAQPDAEHIPGIWFSPRELLLQGVNLLGKLTGTCPIRVFSRLGQPGQMQGAVSLFYIQHLCCFFRAST